MKVVTIAAAKGGTTKTTITLNLAVRAAQESGSVGMFDLNFDQGDLTKWWTLRGEPTNPSIIEVGKIVRDIEIVREAGCEWLFIDTPPLELDVIESAIMKSDAVVIPCRVGFFDLNSVSPIVEMCKRRRRKYSFLLSAVDSKMPKLVEAAMTDLVSTGPVFATRIKYLQPYIASIPRGKTAAELDKSCAPEIDHLWEEVKRLADAAPILSTPKGAKAS